MRISRFSKNSGLLFSVLLAVPTAIADDAASGARYVPPANHFTVATPGAQWLNVSRALKPEDFRDRIVLLDFAPFGNVAAAQTNADLAKLEKEFKKDSFLVVGVHSAKFDNEKEIESIRHALIRSGVTHPVVNDRDFRIWRSFDVRSAPTLVLLKANGDIDQKWVGDGHVDEARKRIVALKAELGKKSTNTSLFPSDPELNRAPKGEFSYPTKLAYDESTRTLFVSDSNHDQIAAYTLDLKKPTLLKPLYRIGKAGEAGMKDGGFSSAQFNHPQGLAFEKGILYVADTENHSIRKIDLKAKTVSTIAGTGKLGRVTPVAKGKSPAKSYTANSTALASPWDIALHAEEGHLLVSMAGGNQLWSLNLKTGSFEVVAGSGAEGMDDGLIDANSLAQPSGMSSLLGSLFFVDAQSSSLRFFFEGYVRTLVGSGVFDSGMKDGDRKKAALQYPTGIYADVSGIFIVDTYNHSVRRYDAQKQTVETVLGDGKRGESDLDKPEDPKSARLNEPSALTKISDPTGEEELFVLSDTNNQRLLFWNRTKNQVQKIEIDHGKSAAAEPVSAPVHEEKAVASKKRFSIHLPNTIPAADVKVNQTNPTVKILLPENYALNPSGESFVRLFEGTPPRETRKQEWETEALKSSLELKLKDLKRDQPYILQATLYFCKNGKSDACETVSISQPIVVEASGKAEIVITIPMKS